MRQTCAAVLRMRQPSGVVSEAQEGVRHDLATASYLSHPDRNRARGLRSLPHREPDDGAPGRIGHGVRG